MNQNVIDNETQEKLDAFIKQEEGDSNSYKGLLAIFITLVAVGMSLFHLYAAYSIVPTHQLRVVHVALVLFLVFLSFPIAAHCCKREVDEEFSRASKLQKGTKDSEKNNQGCRDVDCSAIDTFKTHIHITH